MLSPEAPYPLEGGGPFRTASLLHYLAERYDVDLIAFQHPGQAIAESLPSGLVRHIGLVPLREHSAGILSRAVRNASRIVRQTPPLMDRFSGYGASVLNQVGDRRYDVCVLEHFWTASYLPVLKRVARRSVLNLHNVESAWHASCSLTSGFPRNILHRAFAGAALRAEQRYLGLCDVALVTSEQDARRVCNISATTRVEVYPNAIPWRREVAEDASNLSIAFSGNMEYEPNQSGLRWFLKEVWPALHNRLPRLQFRIIGKNATRISPEVAGLENVVCTGPIEDPFVHLNRATVCIVPLRSGSGTRLKIIEAWAAGRAVVSTTLGAEGLDAKKDENIRIADTPEFFARGVVELIEDKQLRQKIAKAGRALYERKYTWNAAWKTLSDVL